MNVDLSATPAVVPIGGSAVLAWSIRGGLPPLTASIDNGIGSVPIVGTVPVSGLTVSRQYTITVTDAAGNQATSTINVIACGSVSAASATSPVAAHTAGATSPTVVMDATDPSPQYFNAGANYPAGLYYLEYVTGAYDESIFG